MRTCPHCQFLVADGATECSVCHQTLAAPGASRPAAPPGAPGVGTPSPFVTPGGDTAGAPGPSGPAPFGAAPIAPPQFGGAPGALGSPPPPGAYGQPAAYGQPGAGMAPGGPVPPQASPKPGPSTGKVVLVLVAVVGVLGVLGVGALFLLGTTAEVAMRAGTELRSDELDWKAYDDPAGRFSVDMPGTPREDSTEVPTEFGAPTAEADGVVVADFLFNASVLVMVDSMPPGARFDSVPYDLAAAEKGAEMMGIDDAEVVTHGIVDGSAGASMDIEFEGVTGGDDAVIHSRLVIVGPDLYEISVAGPVEDRDELDVIHQRMIETFQPA